jgi:hypothetical protein
VPFVPTVYRMLACYERFLVEAVDALADALRGDRTECFAMAARALGAVAAERLDGPPIDPGADRAAILALIDRYNVANPRNLLFAVGLAGGRPPGAALPIMEPPLPPARDDLLADVEACHGGLTVPGLWRELAAWPEVAGTAWSHVRPLAGRPDFDRARTEILALARRTAGAAAAPEPAGLGYGPEDIAAIDEILAWFPRGISTMVVEIEYLRRRFTDPAVD